MITFKAEIERFNDMGEKTGWSYVFIPAQLAEELSPGSRKSFRVKGMIDSTAISGLALVPMGGGDFILALKKNLRKTLRKEVGGVVQITLALDTEFKIEIPEILHDCLEDEPGLLQQFLKMPKSHQNYYINWLNSAKTEPTVLKRLTMIIKAMEQKQDFGEMIRASKKDQDTLRS